MSTPCDLRPALGDVHTRERQITGTKARNTPIDMLMNKSVLRKNSPPTASGIYEGTGVAAGEKSPSEKRWSPEKTARFDGHELLARPVTPCDEREWLMGRPCGRSVTLDLGVEALRSVESEEGKLVAVAVGLLAGLVTLPASTKNTLGRFKSSLWRPSFLAGGGARWAGCVGEAGKRWMKVISSP